MCDSHRRAAAGRSSAPPRRAQRRRREVTGTARLGYDRAGRDGPGRRGTGAASLGARAADATAPGRLAGAGARRAAGQGEPRRSRALGGGSPRLAAGDLGGGGARARASECSGSPPGRGRGWSIRGGESRGGLTYKGAGTGGTVGAGAVRPANQTGRREAGCRKRCGQFLLLLSPAPAFRSELPDRPLRSLFPVELPARRRQRYTISSCTSMKREQVLAEEVAATLSPTSSGEGRRTHPLAAATALAPGPMLTTWSSQPVPRNRRGGGDGDEPERDRDRRLRPATRRGPAPAPGRGRQVRGPGGENRTLGAYPRMGDLDRVAGLPL